MPSSATRRGRRCRSRRATSSTRLASSTTYGADALRFTLAAMAAQGRDIKLVDAARRGLPQLRDQALERRALRRDERVRAPARLRSRDASSRRSTAGSSARPSARRRPSPQRIEAYKFNEAAGADLRVRVGRVLRLVSRADQADARRATTTRRRPRRARRSAWVLDQILKLLHPFMPFITEELWAHMVEHGEQRENLLALSQWPELSGLVERGGRRGDRLGRAPRLGDPLGAHRDERAGRRQDPARHRRRRARPARARRAPRGDDRAASRASTSITFAKAAPKGAALIVVGETTAALPLAGVIDMGAETKRLAKRDREGAKATSTRWTPSSPTRSSWPRPRKRRSRRRASARPSSKGRSSACSARRRSAARGQRLTAAIARQRDIRSRAAAHP